MRSSSPAAAAAARALVLAVLLAAIGCATATATAAAPKRAPPPPATAPADADTSTGGSTSMSALAVQQRAARDLDCADVVVALASSRGTLRPDHRRNVYDATGCGKEARYLAVCVGADDDGACRAVPAGSDVEQMSPYADP